MVDPGPLSALTGVTCRPIRVTEVAVGRKAKEKKLAPRTVMLMSGARCVHPDDMNIGRYIYPDWRERMNWKKSIEYGPGCK
jgi:hypothetical protein